MQRLLLTYVLQRCRTVPKAFDVLWRKEKALTLQDLDNIWAAQAGKHEAIVKNVHDLLAKLAWDFSPEQLDHLFDCFKV